MRPIFLKFIVLGAVVALFAAQPPVIFESKARIVTSGRDPMIAVRASGALSLMKVEKGDVWLQTTFDGGDSFEPPVRINDVAGEVSSHAESSPQLYVRTMHEFYCLWQARRPGQQHEGSALRFSRSMDWGQSFSKAIDVEGVSGGASQSFFTMNVSPKGIVYAAWLDGRDRTSGRQGTAAVYLAKSVNRGASFEPSVRVALDACPCCRPSIGFTGSDSVQVAWRKVLDDNVRDIFVATSNDGGATWSAGTRVAEDNWVLNGCPHSGAAMASLGKRLFISWYTVREKQAKLYFAFSDDAGKTFSKRYDLSGNVVDPNHPYMLSTDDRISILFQGRDANENQGWGAVNTYYREVDAQGTLSPVERLKHAAGSASYPVLAFEAPGRLYAAWMEPKQDGTAIVMVRGRRVATREVSSAR
jgi:hypothetical protein